MRNNQLQPLPFNIEGRFFTTAHCDGCSQCLSYASDLITFDESDVFSYVYKQPHSNDELQRILKAHTLCPHNALKDAAKIQ